MKKLAIAALMTTFALTGCSTMSLDDKRTMVVEGETMDVKVVNISSFEVEIAPRKAVCELMTATGTKVEAECLQYRQTYQKNYTTLNGNIQGFTYEPNYRYVLDVRQEAMADSAAGVVKPVWILNEVISKTAE
jgi:formaldehyde-activating enzyme involved in methanogenesis